MEIERMLRESFICPSSRIVLDFEVLDDETFQILDDLIQSSEEKWLRAQLEVGALFFDTCERGINNWKRKHLEKIFDEIKVSIPNAGNFTDIMFIRSEEGVATIKEYTNKKNPHRNDYHVDYSLYKTCDTDYLEQFVGVRNFGGGQYSRLSIENMREDEKQVAKRLEEDNNSTSHENEAVEDELDKIEDDRLEIYKVREAFAQAENTNEVISELTRNKDSTDVLIIFKSGRNLSIRGAIDEDIYIEDKGRLYIFNDEKPNRRCMFVNMSQEILDITKGNQGSNVLEMDFNKIGERKGLGLYYRYGFDIDERLDYRTIPAKGLKDKSVTVDFLLVQLPVRK